MHSGDTAGGAGRLGATSSAAEGLVCTSIIRSTLGELFEEHYRELCGLYGDELDDGIVLREVADLIEHLLAADTEGPLLELCCAALEAIVLDRRVEAPESVCDQVLRSLSAPALQRVRSYLGPATDDLLELSEGRGGGE